MTYDTYQLLKEGKRACISKGGIDQWKLESEELFLGINIAEEWA